MLCLNTPLPIPLCTLSTNVKYKTKAAVLNVPVYLFGQCWYKAYLHLFSFACILNGNFYFRNVLCVKMPDSVVQESASAVMLACVELIFM